MSLRAASAIAFITAIFPSATADAQTTRYVDIANCPGPGSGTEGDPFCKIQNGIDAAVDGDTVLIADGVYIGFKNKNLSYDGKAITVQSENGPENCIIDCEGNGRGFQFISGEKNDSRLLGMTITNGKTLSNGGGVLCSSSSPTIADCRLEGNSAVEGGGIYAINSNPEILGTGFVGNKAARGAGFAGLQSSLNFTDCFFWENVASGSSGGGAWCDDGGISILRCDFWANWARGSGGGVSCNDCGGSFRQSTVDANEATTGGGISLVGGGTVLVEQCQFRGNSARARGGGIKAEGMLLFVRSSVIHGNFGGESGGGLELESTTALISDSSLSQNASSLRGGGIGCEGTAYLELTNMIMWQDESAHGAELWVGELSEVSVVFSDVEGGEDSIFIEQGNPPGSVMWGSGNIDEDPLFASPNTGDLHLTTDSPCIDAGVPFFLPGFTERDIDGEPRIQQCRIDMGADESSFFADCNANMLPDACEAADGTASDCNWNSVPDECDIADGTSSDNCRNGVPDECEPDCNGNGQADECDVMERSSEDCNSNTVPDECEPDCNGNGQADECDIDDGFSADCSGNGIPDECEPDCNGNDEADSCDIVAGTSADCNGNGIPDECPGEPTGPPIIQQPVSQEVEVGELVFFSIQADGVPPLEYQWRKDGVELIESERIIGTQSAVLLILDAETSDAGRYDCVVAEPVGNCTTSDPATLTIQDPCPADFDADGAVGPFDLAILLGSWGPCPPEAECPGDLDGDGAVDASDLAILLGNWGPCE